LTSWGPGFRIQWRRKQGTSKRNVYTFIAARPVRAVKAKIRALTPRTSQQDLQYVLTRINMVLHGRASYFKHAIAQRIFDMLDTFTWRRVIRMLRERHRWRWKDVRRRFTTPAGQWLPVTAGEIELSGSPRSRSSGIATTAARSPAPGYCNPPDGRHRGEPVALRGARREVRGNGPGAIPAPRPGLLSEPASTNWPVYRRILYRSSRPREPVPMSASKQLTTWVDNFDAGYGGSIVSAAGSISPTRVVMTCPTTQRRTVDLTCCGPRQLLDDLDSFWKLVIG
jgi:hypothetical protein